MLFIKKTRSRSSNNNFFSLLIKLLFLGLLIFGLVFLLNKIDFPAPTKEIEKIIPNENFKIVK
tara:strand:+ start:1204 stop:1392 length:189 start_codon:yes stop_codon:yes gene_type:complete